MVPLLARPTVHMLKIFLLVSALTLAAAALASPRAAQAPAPVLLAAKPDACALLTGEEISAAQGSDLRRTVPSEPTGAAFHVSQCYYEAAISSRSISLMLASPAPHKSVRPRDYWNQHFHPAEKESRAEKSEKGGKPKSEEDEEAREKLREVEGIGEEAFWESGGVTGALYVLKKDAFLRISVGGADTDAARLEKAKKLAAHALARLGQ